MCSIIKLLGCKLPAGAVSSMLIVVVVFLQDAADQYKMDGTTYKTLNVSLAAIAAGNASSLW